MMCADVPMSGTPIDKKTMNATESQKQPEIVSAPSVWFCGQRLKLAGWLCLIACWLRGEKWYVGEAWHAVPGNRATDLQQQIWQDVVLISYPPQPENEDAINRISKNLGELSQAAGEAWGHIWPQNAALCGAAHGDGGKPKIL